MTLFPFFLRVFLHTFQCMGNGENKKDCTVVLPWLTWTWSVQGNWGMRGSPWWGHGSPWARPRGARTSARGSPSASSWSPAGVWGPGTRTPARTWSTTHSCRTEYYYYYFIFQKRDLSDQLQVLQRKKIRRAGSAVTVSQKVTWTEACCRRIPGARSRRAEKNQAPKDGRI